MKKLLLIGVLVALFPLSTKAALMGFTDGSLFNPEKSVTEPEYICFISGECLAKDGTVTTREALGLEKPVSAKRESAVVYIPLEPSPITVPLQVFNQQTSQSINQSTMPTLLPAYTQTELLQKFFANTPADTQGKKLAFTTERYFPVYVNRDKTSAAIGWNGHYGNYKDCEVTFNGDVVLTPDKTFIELKGLQPGTKYEYQVVYKEAGREDTVLTGTFSTLD